VKEEQEGQLFIGVSNVRARPSGTLVIAIDKAVMLLPIQAVVIGGIGVF
jgi:hypothetical protein